MRSLIDISFCSTALARDSHVYAQRLITTAHPEPQLGQMISVRPRQALPNLICIVVAPAPDG